MPPVRTILYGPCGRHNFGDMLFPHVVATLLPTHVEAWRETWSQSIIEFEGDDFVKRAINSTLCEI